MSEIEKMYMRCKIKKRQTCRSSDTCYNGSLNKCEGCNSYQYPPFTPEKQLELIKWLAGFWVHINKVNGQFNISTSGGYVSYYAEDLADAIALYINSKWDNLTKSEQEQIRSILNG